jgi:hypothetical protein
MKRFAYLSYTQQEIPVLSDPPTRRGQNDKLVNCYEYIYKRMVNYECKNYPLI